MFEVCYAYSFILSVSRSWSEGSILLPQEEIWPAHHTHAMILIDHLGDQSFWLFAELCGWGPAENMASVPLWLGQSIAVHHRRHKRYARSQTLFAIFVSFVVYTRHRSVWSDYRLRILTTKCTKITKDFAKVNTVPDSPKNLLCGLCALCELCGLYSP